MAILKKQCKNEACSEQVLECDETEHGLGKSFLEDINQILICTGSCQKRIWHLLLGPAPVWSDLASPSPQSNSEDTFWTTLYLICLICLFFPKLHLNHLFAYCGFILHVINREEIQSHLKCRGGGGGGAVCLSEMDTPHFTLSCFLAWLLFMVTLVSACVLVCK